MMGRKPKDKTNQAETPDVEAVPVSPISHEEIALCAYYIWEAEGRPEARAVEHWLQAELQLKATPALDGHPLTEDQPDQD